MGIAVSRPTLGEEELAAVAEVFKTGWLGLGDRVKRFESEIALYVGAPRVVAASTGTSALHLALVAGGVGPGDDVLLPSFTFVASPQAVVMAGARPVFCDVDPDTGLLTLDEVQKRRTPKTKAILPVHYAGAACDMDALLAYAEAEGLIVVEDAAHAFGSTWRGRRLGGFGHLTVFSFDPIKTITSIEGGAVATARAEWADKMEKMRLLGIEGDSWARYQNKRRWFYDVPSPGFRYHLGNVNAAVGLCQLKKIDVFIAHRRRVVNAYNEAFRALPGLALFRHDVAEAAPFMYAVRVLGGRRDAFMAFLAEKGVDTGVHYIPNHLHSFFRGTGGTSLPATEKLFNEIATLPLFSHISEDEVATVIGAVKAFF